MARSDGALRGLDACGVIMALAFGGCMVLGFLAHVGRVLLGGG